MPVSLGAPCPYRPLCAGPIGDLFLGQGHHFIKGDPWRRKQYPGLISLHPPFGSFSIEDCPGSMVGKDPISILLPQIPEPVVQLGRGYSLAAMGKIPRAGFVTSDSLGERHVCFQRIANSEICEAERVVRRTIARLKACRCSKVLDGGRAPSP